MDTKFTPGPWQWFDPANDEPVRFAQEIPASASLRTVDEFGESKTEVITGKSYTSFRLPKFILDADTFGSETAQECAANAHLIATAPCLYEALAGFVTFHSGHAMANSELAARMEKGRAALARARGESK